MGVCTESREIRNSRFSIYSSTQLEFFYNQIEKCLCKIKSNNLGYGTGFLCRIFFPNKVNYLPVLIANNNIIEKDDIEIGKKIIFFLGNKKYIIKIDNFRKTFINEKYNIIIIEIKQNDKLEINSFLEIDKNIFKKNLNEIYYGKSIYLLYYEKQKYPKYSSSEIKSIDMNSYTFEHSCLCEIESLGSPLINLSNFKVIGIHKGILEGKDRKIGIFLKEPLKEFYKLYESNINYKSKSINYENKNNKPKINLKFQTINGKDLYLEVKESIYFKSVIEELYDKYSWLKNIKIIDFKFNEEHISRSKTIKESGLNEKTTIKIIEE